MNFLKGKISWDANFHKLLIVPEDVITTNSCAKGDEKVCIKATLYLYIEEDGSYYTYVPKLQWISCKKMTVNFSCFGSYD